MAGEPAGLKFYPAYCHSASPTYFTWVKLSASDIHSALRSRPGFSATTNNNQQSCLLFYLNHPVQFVYICGVVVALDTFEKVWVFTVDDSSGATVDVTCKRPEKATSATKNDTDGVEQKRSNGIADDDTRVQLLDSEIIDVGTVVKVKGTIGTFRDLRQIALERLSVVVSTNEEMQFWQQRSQLLASTLSKPWIVSGLTQERLYGKAEGEVKVARGEAAKVREKRARRLAREVKDAEKIQRRWEKEEMKRKRCAEDAKVHGEMLQRRDVGSMAGTLQTRDPNASPKKSRTCMEYTVRMP